MIVFVYTYLCICLYICVYTYQCRLIHLLNAFDCLHEKHELEEQVFWIFLSYYFEASD